jgi:hypothetical protein
VVGKGKRHLLAKLQGDEEGWRGPCGGGGKQGTSGDGNEMIALFGVAVEHHQLRRGGGAVGPTLDTQIGRSASTGATKGELIYQPHL